MPPKAAPETNSVLDYTYAFFSGLTKAVANIGGMVAHPLDTVVYPVASVLADAFTIAMATDLAVIKHAKSLSPEDVSDALGDPSDYLAAVKRMEQRSQSGLSAVDYILNEATGPQRLEATTELCATAMLPGTAVRCLKNIMHNIKVFDSIKAPPAYRTLDISDTSAVHLPVKYYTAQDIRRMNLLEDQTVNLMYVMLENGKTLITDHEIGGALKKRHGYSADYKHGDLADNNPVICAGHVSIQRRGNVTEIVYADNNSGHFCPAPDKKTVKKLFVDADFPEIGRHPDRLNIYGEELFNSTAVRGHRFQPGLLRGGLHYGAASTGLAAQLRPIFEDLEDKIGDESVGFLARCHRTIFSTAWGGELSEVSENQKKTLVNNTVSRLNNTLREIISGIEPEPNFFDSEPYLKMIFIDNPRRLSPQKQLDAYIKKLATTEASENKTAYQQLAQEGLPRVQEKIEELTRITTETAEPEMPSGTKKNISRSEKAAQLKQAKDNHCAMDNIQTVGDCAYAAAIVADVMGSDKAGPLMNVAMGAGIFHGAYASLAASGVAMGPAGLAAAGVILVGQGIYGLLRSKSSPAQSASPFLDRLNHLTNMIAGLSTQITRWGQYSAYRFDDLKALSITQHVETISLLQKIVFDHTLSVSDLKRLVNAQSEETIENIRALTVLVKSSILQQRAQLSLSIKNQIALLEEFHFLQVQLDLRAEHAAQLAMEHPETLNKTLMTHARALHQATIKECYGSSSLTGLDLNMDLNASNQDLAPILARLKPDDRKPENTPVRAAYHVNALLKYFKQKAEQPNTALVKARATCFLELLQTYQKAHGNEIPAEILLHLKEVMAYLGKSNEFIEKLPLKTFFEKIVTDLKVENTNIDEAFKKKKTDYFDKIREKNKEAQRDRFAHMMSLYHLCGLPDLTFLEQTCTISTSKMTCFKQPDFWIEASDWVAQYMQEIEAPVPLLGLEPPYHNEWGHITLVDNVIKSMISPWHHSIGGGYWFNDPALEYSVSYKGQTKEMIKRAIVPSWGSKATKAQIESLSTVDVDQAAERKAWTKKKETLATEHRVAVVQYQKDFNIAADSLALGPRVITPEAGSGLSLNLYFTQTMLDTHIPYRAFIAEWEGYGEIILTYNAQFTEETENEKELSFELKVCFLPKNEVTPIVLCTASYKARKISPIYKRVEEVVALLWHGMKLYISDKVDLSCHAFQHVNPVWVRSEYDNLYKHLIVNKAFKKDAGTALKQLIKKEQTKRQQAFIDSVTLSLENTQNPLTVSLLKYEIIQNICINMAALWSEEQLMPVTEVMKKISFTRAQLLAHLKAEQDKDTDDLKIYRQSVKQELLEENWAGRLLETCTTQSSEVAEQMTPFSTLEALDAKFEYLLGELNEMLETLTPKPVEELEERRPPALTFALEQTFGRQSQKIDELAQQNTQLLTEMSELKQMIRSLMSKEVKEVELACSSTGQPALLLSNLEEAVKPKISKAPLSIAAQRRERKKRHKEFLGM